MCLKFCSSPLWYQNKFSSQSWIIFAMQQWALWGLKRLLPLGNASETQGICMGSAVFYEYVTLTFPWKQKTDFSSRTSSTVMLPWVTCFLPIVHFAASLPQINAHGCQDDVKENVIQPWSVMTFVYHLKAFSEQDRGQPEYSG